MYMKMYYPLDGFLAKIFSLFLGVTSVVEFIHKTSVTLFVLCEPASNSE